MHNDVVEIAIDMIDEPEMAMRENVRDDEIESLMASIKQVGLLEPLVVRPVGDRFGLIAGHRRLTALKLLGKALCLAKILDVSEKDALIIRMHENSHRENVNPVDEAVYIGKVMTEIGLSVSEISERMNRSVGYVYDRLSILEFPEYLINAVAEKKISISAAIALNKIPDEITKRNFVSIAAKDGITLERANAWVAMVNVGAITQETTPEQIQAMEQPEQHNEVLITCAKCKQPAKIRDMVTVWIHKYCDDVAKTTE
jgi:ParB family chromosome partitioning protein